MSTRLREAAGALDDARRVRAVVPPPAAPDLFGAADDWTRSASAHTEWTDQALDVVHATACRLPHLTVEDILPQLAPTVDRRAVGGIMRRAARLGWLESAGWADGGATRHGRPITRWRSLVHQDAA
jgi:hypothetical protein